jgi:hypothetical protein
MSSASGSGGSSVVARRFRLDQAGNLHADGLFCRPMAFDVALRGDARAWVARKKVENRTAKATAMLGFETAVHHGDWTAAMTLAREVHVLMLAQRFMKPPKGVAGGAKALANNASRSPL